MNTNNELISIFGSIEDPRSHINQLLNLVDILLVGIISVICGAKTWKQMIEFAHSKKGFLKKFLELPNGIPSEDTINRVFSSINSSQFETCFIDWVNSICNLSKGQVITIDGKTIRGAKSKGKKSPVHMVSAWANQNNLVLEQVKVNEKSNEITAILELIDNLFIEGNIAFSEDASRKRNNNAVQNYSILLKIALNLLRNEKTEKQGIAGKRLKAGWNENYLLKVLNSYPL